MPAIPLPNLILRPIGVVLAIPVDSKLFFQWILMVTCRSILGISLASSVSVERLSIARVTYHS